MADGTLMHLVDRGGFPKFHPAERELPWRGWRGRVIWRLVMSSEHAGIHKMVQVRKIIIYS